MNIKSLLLGSAAALLAVSGARAADAVTVAEPEPAEYVKICDVYGAGYFYIPGTEICLRIHGYLRYDAAGGQAGSFDGRDAVDVMNGGSQRSWHKLARFDFQTDTGQETELGTLKTHTETRFDYSDGSTSTDTHFAWISLGGLRLGVDESAFDTWVGYAGNVIQDTLVPYGGFGTNFIQYTFDAGNGFSAMAAVEEGSNGQVPGVTDLIDSYMPHVLVGAKYTQGWGDIIGVVAYNSNWEEWSGKVRLDVNVNDQLTLWAMGGYGTDDNIGRQFYKPWGGNWAIWAGGTFKVNEKTSLNAQVSYDDGENLGVAANVAYTIVPGFTVTAEIDYANLGNDGFNWTGMPAGKDSAVGGIVRFQRDF